MNSICLHFFGFLLQEEAPSMYCATRQLLVCTTLWKTKGAWVAAHFQSLLLPPPQFFVISDLQDGNAAFHEFEATGTTYAPKGDM